MKEIDLYRRRKPELVKYVKDKGFDSIGLYCTCNQFNLIVAYTYVMEDFPEYEEECREKINGLKTFYNIKD